MKTVKAIARGYIGGRIREPEDIFEVKKDTKGTWFVPYPDKEETNKKGSAKPRTSKAETGPTEDLV